MAGRLILDACNPALDSNGRVDADATLEFFENRTSTHQAVYSDATLLDNLDNPLSPDASGRFPEIWGPDGSVYTVEWTPSGESAITFNDIALAASPSDPSLYYDMYRWLPNVMEDAQTVLIANIPRGLSLPATLNDGFFPSLFSIETNPTADLILTLKKNATTIGTVTFSTAGAATVSVVSPVFFVAGDKFKVIGPGTHDATGAGLALTFVFNVSN